MTDLPAWHGYFDGNPTGFQFVIPGYALSGEVTEHYDTAMRRWVVEHTSGSETWRGVGKDRVAAYLDMIAVRLNVDVFARPRRGDNVEEFIKRHRDQHGTLTENYPTDEWRALDALLDNYRTRCDEGRPLTDGD